MYEECCTLCNNIIENIQFKWCKTCQINDLRENFTNHISGNEEVDNFIQKKQLGISNYNDIIIEWIPYHQFEKIKEIGKDDLSTVYLATWKDGPLNYEVDKREYKRISNKTVVLKFLDNSQYEFLNKCFKINVVGNKKIDDLIQKMQLKIHNPGTLVFEWIPYDKFINLKEIDKGGFSVIYSAIWEDGPLYYDFSKMEYIRDTCKKVALKCLNNSQNITDNFFNEIEKYSTDNFSLCILKTYGISQVPDTNDYIMVLEYAENGLKEIHRKGLVHRDFHTGNILLMTSNFGNDISFISDMGLCGEVGNMDETKTNIYGVMPYVAPEVLRGKPSTHSADIYSFAMIMYFVAARKQPFVDHAHDNVLALDICNGIRPEINEQEAPKCYIDLMNKCWDSKPQNRPNAIEIDKLILSFRDNFIAGKGEQFKELEISIENNQSSTHSQAIYTSRLLNPFTKNLPHYDENKISDCLDCAITN
ncbi:polo kinase CDC5 [Rhizophagus irregularis DAOM 197198w]|uniref:Polo kinase CDC5 n=1 Tax=Rhizophagus irregularis (strain DAOM 197198w) TaxID=1432141 RepID=A0A015JZ82_RHIIW|nr:polo kinase CDC5 [Rhizophagus irregularis DAOM 197198w]